MTVQVNTREFDAVLSAIPSLVLGANNSRKFLEIQNKGAVAVRFKMDKSFTPSQSLIQTLTFNRIPTGGAWTLTNGTDITGTLAYGASAGDIQTALQALASIGSGNVAVAGNYSNGFTFTFQGALANIVVPPLSMASNTLTDNTVNTNAVQNLNFSLPPTGGTFRVGDGDSETADLAWNISTTDFATALNALTNINGGVASITQDPTSLDITITFGTTLAAKAVPLLLITDNQLSCNSSVASEDVTIYSTGSPLQGTFKLMFGTDMTSEIPYNASAAQIQAALEYLPSIGVGNVVVSGSWSAGWEFVFQNNLADTAVPLLEIFTDTSTPLHMDTEVEPYERLEPEFTFVSTRSTTGAGIQEVITSFVTVIPGVSPANVLTVLSQTQAGFPAPDDGLTIEVGGSKKYESAVPLGAVFMVAAGTGSVTIFEG